MVICRFYLQGNCRYGDRCWYDHGEFNEDFTSDDYSFPPQRSKYAQLGSPRSGFTDQYHWRAPDSPSGNKSVAFSFAKAHEESFTSNRFSALSHSDQTTKDNKVDVKSIADDISSWKNSGQWLFTCYGPVKNKSCIPGLEDISQEELRWGAYQALSSGNFETYVNFVKVTIEQIKMKREEISRFSPEICQILEKIHQGIPIPVNSSGDNKQASLGISSFASGQPSTQADIPTFSFKAAYNQDSNLHQNNFFQDQHQCQQENISNYGNFSFAEAFAKHNSGFGDTSGSELAFTQQTSSFGQNSVSSFPNVTNSLGVGQDKALFGSGSFASATEPMTKTESKSTVYTALDELNEDENEQFMSQTFTLGKIPIRPPPIELCF